MVRHVSALSKIESGVCFAAEIAPWLQTHCAKPCKLRLCGSRVTADLASERLAQLHQVLAVLAHSPMICTTSERERARLSKSTKMICCQVPNVI